MTVVAMDQERRFAARIESMVEADKQLAIDTMLKALKKLGVVETFAAMQTVGPDEQEEASDLFLGITKSQMTERLAAHLQTTGHIAFSAVTAADGFTDHNAKITVVNNWGR